MCGCEGMIVGKGNHTLAFVRWRFPFSFQSLCNKFSLLYESLLGLLVTVDGMVSCGITKQFPIKFHRLFNEPLTFENLCNPHALNHVLCSRSSFVWSRNISKNSLIEFYICLPLISTKFCHYPLKQLLEDCQI